MEKIIKNFVKSREQINDTRYEASLLEYLEESQKTYNYKLLDHQLDALKRLITQMDSRGVLAMEMGCGKTLTAILYSGFAHQLFKCPVLYISPSNLKTYWASEALRFNGQQVIVIDKIRDMAELKQANPDCYSYVVSYDIFLKLTNLDEKYIVVVDEAHEIKNDGPTSTNIQTRIDEIAEKVILLTATPLINNGAEAYNYLRTLFPEVFKNKKQFWDFFFELKQGMFGKVVPGEMKEDNIELFYDLFDLVTIKCYIKVVLPDLPVKTRTLYTFKNRDENLAADLQAYNDFCKSVYRTPGYVKTRKDATKIGSMVNRLYIDTGVSKSRQALPLIKELVLKHSEEKGVIWVKHKESLRFLLKHIPNSVGLHGDHSDKVRDKVLLSMQDKDHPTKVLIATIDAYGKGINLSPGCTFEIFVELAMTYHAMYQAEARLHRTGTISPVASYWLFCEGSRDEKTLDLINGKKDMVDTLFTGTKQASEYIKNRQQTIEDDNFFEFWIPYESLAIKAGETEEENDDDKEEGQPKKKRSKTT